MTINGAYRKVKGGYLTISGAWRKVKKAYITIGGVWRPCWAGGKLTYYGLVNGLTISSGSDKGDDKRVGAVVGNHAVYAGNYDVAQDGEYDEYGDWVITDVYAVAHATDAFDSSLTKKSASKLSYPRERPAVAVVGGNALFAGGYDHTYYSDPDISDPDDNYLSFVESFNTSLTRSNRTSLTRGVDYIGGASTGSHALFAGGLYECKKSTSGLVWAYNTSLSRSTATALPQGLNSLQGLTVGTRALFFSGRAYTHSTAKSSQDKTLMKVYSYDEGLTRYTATDLTNGRMARGATVGDWGIIGSGANVSGTTYNKVEAYSSSLTKRTLTAFSTFYYNYAYSGTGIGEYAVFAGTGANAEVYDSSLTRSTLAMTTMAGTTANAVTVGNFGVFIRHTQMRVVTIA